MLVFASPVICRCGFSGKRSPAAQQLLTPSESKSGARPTETDARLLDYRREEGIIDYRRGKSSSRSSSGGASPGSAASPGGAAAVDVPLKCVPRCEASRVMCRVAHMWLVWCATCAGTRFGR